MSDVPKTAASPAVRRWVMLAFGVAGALLVLWESRYGLGISSDSVDYVTAARSLAAGRGLIDSWRHPYVTWPPLLPVVLALLRPLGSNYLDPARYFQVLVYGLLDAMVVGILWQDLRRRWLAVAGGLLIVGSYPILVVSSRLLSEPLYCLLIVVTIYLYPRARAQDRLRKLLWIAVPAGLAALQRYAGVGLIAGVWLYLLLESGTGNLWRRLQRASFFAAIASAPLVVWLVHNLVVRNSLTGPRAPSRHPFWGTLAEALRLPGSWWVPRRFGPVVAVALISVLFVLLVASLVPQTSSGRRLPRLPARIRFGGWLALSHIAFMVASFMVAQLTHLDTRFVTPAAPGLVLLLAGGADGLLSWPRRRGTTIAMTAATTAVLGLCLFTSAQLVRQRLAFLDRTKAATAWSGARWLKSPILAWVRDRTGVREKVYTNVFYVVTFYCPDRLGYFRNLDQIADLIERGVPGAYVLFNRDRWGDETARVAALAARHPDLVRIRGPLGVVLSVGAGPHDP